MNTPDPSYSPPDANPNEPPGEDRGSLLTGFLLGWAVLIATSILVGIVLTVISSMGSYSNDLSALLGLLLFSPFVATLALMISFTMKGKTRSAAGVGLTFASLFGLALLLVAACFGLLAHSNFH